MIIPSNSYIKHSSGQVDNSHFENPQNNIAFRRYIGLHSFYYHLTRSGDFFISGNPCISGPIKLQKPPRPKLGKIFINPFNLERKLVILLSRNHVKLTGYLQSLLNHLFIRQRILTLTPSQALAVRAIAFECGYVLIRVGKGYLLILRLRERTTTLRATYKLQSMNADELSLRPVQGYQHLGFSLTSSQL